MVPLCVSKSLHEDIYSWMMIYIYSTLVALVLSEKPKQAQLLPRYTCVQREKELLSKTNPSFSSVSGESLDKDQMARF